MKRRFSEFQVGVLTIIALAVLIGGMMWLKNIDLTKGSRLYQVDFARVEGMRVGDRVQVRGIRMGEVTGMHIMQSAVRVELSLDETVDLREDAVVTLGEKGIVGEVVIEVDPGTGAAVKEGHIFQGRTAGTIASMTDAAGAALAEMRELTRKVTELVDRVQAEGKVTETLIQANETLVKVDSMVTENHGDVVVILENLRVTTDRLRDLMDSGRRLDAILTEVESGDGTAAKLLRDDALYVHADSTLVSLKRLLDELRRNPKKYFQVNVMDF